MPEATVNGVRIHYMEWNPGAPGTPLVFLHGWTADWEEWRAQAEHFAGKGRRVLAVDHRGHGQSEAPRGDYSISTFAGDLRALLDQKGIQGAVLAGHSMGGMIAQRFTLDNPGRVERLILSGTSAKVAEGLKMKFLTLLNGLFFTLLYRPSLRLNIKMAYRKSTPLEVVRAAQEKHLKTPRHATLGAYWGFLLHHDTRRDLPRITIPTLILVGRKDRLLPWWMSRRLHESIPGSKLVVYPEDGHQAVEQKAADVNREIETFLG